MQIFNKNRYDIMRRKIYNDLLKWKTERQGSVALLIEGARRVTTQTPYKSSQPSPEGTLLTNSRVRSEAKCPVSVAPRQAQPEGMRTYEDE